MSNYTCVKCGCEDIIPSAPCPTSEGCPTPSKCEETFNTECLVYSGENLLCGDTTIANTDDPINTVLAAIVDEICAVKTNSSFIVTIEDETDGLSCTVSTTTLPLTFQWTIEQGTFVGHTITGSSTASAVVLDPVIGNTLRVGTLSSITGELYMSLIKLEVTNGMGNKVTKYYTYAKLA